MAASLRFLSYYPRPHPDARTRPPPWKLLSSPSVLCPPIIPSSSRSLSLHLPPTGSSRISASSSGKPRLNSASTFAEEMLQQLHRQMEMAIAQEVRYRYFHLITYILLYAFVFLHIASILYVCVRVTFFSDVHMHVLQRFSLS
mgnify:CR=1 FL=1